MRVAHSSRPRSIRARDLAIESRTQKESTRTAESYLLPSYTSMPDSAIGRRKNTTTTYIFGVGPPGLKGPVRLHSSHPPRARPEHASMICAYYRCTFCVSIIRSYYRHVMVCDVPECTSMMCFFYTVINHSNL
jgi:hypothetical protein